MIGSPPESESAPHTRVVVASPNAVLRLAVRSAVQGEFTEVVFADSQPALAAVESPPDIVVLDYSAPDFMSMESLEWARRRWPSITIIAIGVSSEDDATRLLRAGADDAVIVSSSPDLLLARLEAAARRARANNAQYRRRLGDVVYDRESRRVWCAGEELDLTPNETALLDRLWSRAGQVVHYDSLHDFVWTDSAPSESSNRVEVYISYLRKKLQRSNEVVIETLRGSGYRLSRKKKE